MTLLITLLITGVFIVAIIWNLSFILLLPFVPAAIICFIICFNSYPVVQKYVINPYYEQRGEVNPEIGTADTDDEEVILKIRAAVKSRLKRVKGKKVKLFHKKLFTNEVKCGIILNMLCTWIKD